MQSTFRGKRKHCASTLQILTGNKSLKVIRPSTVKPVALPLSVNKAKEKYMCFQTLENVHLE
jgi:hypothetical protein